MSKRPLTQSLQTTSRAWSFIRNSLPSNLDGQNFAGSFFSPVQIRIDDTKRIVANDMGHDLLSRLQNLENLQTDYKKQLDKHIREIAELQQRILPLCVLRAKILDDAAKYTWKDSRYLTRRNGVAHGGNISETQPKGI